MRVVILTMESLSPKLSWRSNKVNELFEGLGRKSKRYRSKRSRLMDFEHEVSVMSDRSKPPNLEDWIYTKWQAVRIKWQAKCILTFSHCFLIILLSSIAIIIIDLECNTLCDYTLHFFLCWLWWLLRKEMCQVSLIIPWKNMMICNIFIQGNVLAFMEFLSRLFLMGNMPCLWVS